MRGRRLNDDVRLRRVTFVYNLLLLHHRRCFQIIALSLLPDGVRAVVVVAAVFVIVVVIVVVVAAVVVIVVDVAVAVIVVVIVVVVAAVFVIVIVAAVIVVVVVVIVVVVIIIRLPLSPSGICTFFSRESMLYRLVNRDNWTKPHEV